MNDGLNSFPTTFGGTISFQCWADLMLHEMILNDTAGLKAIVELGTAYGGFSNYLLSQARLRDLEFHTFDCHDPDEVPLKDLWDLPRERYKLSPQVREHMQVVDILAGLSLEVVEVIADRRVVLFCDNGDKPREVEIYHEYIFPGSILVVHDWNAEIFAKDIPSNFVELYGDVCDEIGSKSRVFRKQ